MTFIAFWILLFGILAVVINYLLARHGTPHKRYVLSAAHFLVILVLAVDVYANRNDAQMGMTWIAAMILDFPISMLYITAKPVLRALGEDNYLRQIVYIPTAFHGIFGTLQYYCIGYLVDRRKEIKNSEQAHQ